MDNRIIHNILLKKAKEADYKKIEIEEINAQYESILIEYYLQRETMIKLEKISISEERIKELYELNKEKFMYDARIKIDTIFLKDKNVAKRILEEINIKNFEEFKEKYDEKSIQAKDNLVNAIPLSKLDVRIIESVNKAQKKGIIKKIVEVDGGYHIIWLKEKEESRLATFDEAKAFIFEEAKKDMYVKIYNEVINEILNEEAKIENKEENSFIKNDM